MPRPTPEEKERFLEYIRGGDDRGTAAWRLNPDYTGTMFRSMCNPRSTKNYDPEFARAYDEALAIRGPLDPNRQQVHSGERESQALTPQGYTRAMHLTDEQLDAFLELVRDGVPVANAAQKIEPKTSITQIHRRAARDTDFGHEYADAKDEGYAAFKENIRAETERQAFAGDYRALRDLMLMHIEEAGVLRTSKHEIGGMDGNAIRVFAERNFSSLPPEMLEALIRELEQKELGP